MTLIRSRIHQYISKDLMDDLKKICTDVKISDNNTKVRLIREALQRHDLDYHELGPGTNRFAILIDNYVFKIAMDKWGVLDNDNEFSMTEVLQPYVTTVYETNGLICVSEYVTLVSKEEFVERKNEIIKILSVLSEGFLLGDVGYHPKNFANWGYRTDGSLVILDFAYIYNIVGDEILCPKDSNLLQYDENFNELRCPYCRIKYSTIAIRKRITSEHEQQEIRASKEAAYAVTQPVTEFEDKEEEEDDDEIKEEKGDEDMVREFTDEEILASHMKLMKSFGDPNQYKSIKTEQPQLEEEEPVVDDELSKISERVMQSGYIKPEPIEEEESPTLNDPIFNIINAVAPIAKKPVEVVEEPKEEEVEEEVISTTNPLEALMIANGIDPDEQDEHSTFNPKYDYENGEGEGDEPQEEVKEEVIVEEEEIADIVEENPNGEDEDENLEDPVEIVYPPKDEEIEETTSQGAFDGMDEEMFASISETQQTEVPDVIPPHVPQVTDNEQASTIEDGDHGFYEDMIPDEIPGDEDETETVVVEEVVKEKPKLRPSTIRHVGKDEPVETNTTTVEPNVVGEATQVVEQPVVVEETVDLMGDAIRLAQQQQQHWDDEVPRAGEQDKYEQMAERFTGKDPYDY